MVTTTEQRDASPPSQATSDASHGKFFKVLVASPTETIATSSIYFWALVIFLNVGVYLQEQACARWWEVIVEGEWAGHHASTGLWYKPTRRGEEEFEDN